MLLQLTIPRFQEFVEKIEERAPDSRLKRTPFILSCAALYLGMVAPVVLSARYASSAPDIAVIISKASLAAALVGGLVEAVGDFQKSAFKARQTEERWVDQGLYAWLRHPNYTGEQLLWAGSFVAGLSVAAGNLAAAWPWVVGGAFGLAGIQFVLMMATTGLERRQQEAYGTMTGFQEYKQQTWAGFTLPPKKAESTAAAEAKEGQEDETIPPAPSAEVDGKAEPDEKKAI